MSKFIELTRMYWDSELGIWLSSDKGQKVLIRPDCINVIIPDGPVTELRLNDTSCPFMVKESPDEIARLIEDAERL